MLIRHFVHSIRLLRQAPGFTAAAVLTLALGIGANTAVFSVVDAVLLRQLPYADPGRLVSLENGPGGGSLPPGNLPDYRRVRAFDGVAGYNRMSLTLTGAGAPEQIRAEAVSGNLLDVLGTPPAIGRAFRQEEDRPGGEQVVILMHTFWRTKFNADPTVLGRSISLNGLPTTIVGVMAEGFEPLSQPPSGFIIHAFVPAAYAATLLGERRGGVDMVARLKPGVRLAEAQAELSALSQDLAARLPEVNAKVAAHVTPVQDRQVSRVRSSLLVMLAAVALVLLVSCVNLGNLMIVRALGQTREAAIRLALGATRTQVAVELVVRGIVLGAIGGAAGLAVGLVVRNALVAVAPPTIPGLDQVALNLRVLGVTFGLSLLTGAIAGLLPAVQLGRGHAAPVLRQSAPATTGTLTRWRGMLTALEIAAALVLAIGAGLLIRSLIGLARVDLGYDMRGVLVFTVRPPAARYGSLPARMAFFDEIERRLQAVDGVQSVAMASEFPVRGGWRDRVLLAGDATERRAGYQAVTPGYFATLSIPVLRGRLLESGDRRGAPLAAVVTELFERRFTAGRDAVGQRFRLERGGPEVTIVGVVGDIRRDGRAAALTPQVFLSAAQVESYPARIEEFAVRVPGDPYDVVPAVRRAIWSIDPDQPITNVQSLDDIVIGWDAGRRYDLLLLGGLALVAVALALVGVYGVAAHAALQRTREIGIRIALGARRGHVIALVVFDGAKWALAGTATGLASAYAASRVMTGLVVGVAPTDGLTFATAGALAIAVTLAASYVPARRAAACDPLKVLRLE